MQQYARSSLQSADRLVVSRALGLIQCAGLVEQRDRRTCISRAACAEREVRNLMGVLGVSNQITIKPRVDTSGLSDDIQHALHRSWFFDEENVHVTAQEGRVRLTGTVGSWQERQTAAYTAWAAPGATSVLYDLIVA